MVRDRYNVVPVTLAVILHVLLFGSLIVAFDFSQANRPAVPLAIKGTLITDSAVVLPPPVELEEAEPVTPEPVTPDVEPDNAEQLRIEAEEQKRREDAQAEQERLERIREAEAAKKRVAEEAEKQRLAEEAERKRRAEEAETQRLAEEAERKRQAEEAEKQRLAEEAERKRQAEADEKQRLVDEAERKKREEAELERLRVEAERKREADIERQRQENERLRREAEADARRVEIGAEDARIAAVDAGALERYMFALQQKVERNWVKPASAGPGLECVVSVRQLPGGDVVGVTIGTCNGDAAVVRSIEAAIYKASPLPMPSDPNLFERNLRFTFKPEQ
jgi:colicin import membrane protein